MIVRYAILCDYSNETNDGKLNLFGVTEAVFAHEFPAVHKHCHLIVSYMTEPDDFGTTREMTVHLIDADGKRLIEIKGPLQCPNRTAVINHRHIIHDLQLPTAGMYQFSLQIDGREVATRGLEAVLVKKEV